MRCSEDIDLKTIDLVAKNKRCWSWMDEVAVLSEDERSKILPLRKGPSLEIPLKRHIRKVREDVIYVCILCNKTKKNAYGGRGIKSLIDHVKTQGHVRKLLDGMENFRMPGLYMTLKYFFFEYLVYPELCACLSECYVYYISII